MSGKYSQVQTFIPRGLTAYPSVVEASILPGLPSFSLSGLSKGKAHDIESRIRAAICNSGLDWPRGRIITSIAPAWLDKSGSLFDLPLALAVIQASEQAGDLSAGRKFAVIGELGLQGQIRKVPGIVSCLEIAAKSDSFLLLPEDNLPEAHIFPDLGYRQVRDLAEALDYYRGVKPLKPRSVVTSSPEDSQTATSDLSLDTIKSFAAFRGQSTALRGLTLGLAGWHHLIALGTPGSGKSMLLSLAPYLLPSLEAEEKFELQKLYALAEDVDSDFLNCNRRPFLAPHSSVTKIALIGGGNPVQPGLFSLAHKGLLFLDELTEYPSTKTEALREALSKRELYLARADERVELPADFLLLAAANPCSCGLALEAGGKCSCSPRAVTKHLNKISGPLWDRFQLLLTFRRESIFSWEQTDPDLGEARKRFLELRAQITNSWQRQKQRFELLHPDLDKSCYLNGKNPWLEASKDYGFSQKLASKAGVLADQSRASLRQYRQLLQVARTIADWEGREEVLIEDLEEAYSYRVRPTEYLGFN
ncbi:MAG: ATP-binding protein [Eubacteriales bacterium]|nr:ATP-binding protein [Eubacteriales bacterium]